MEEDKSPTIIITEEDTETEFVTAEEHEQQQTANNVNNSGRIITQQHQAKPRYYKQIYRTAWEDMPEFKGWLRGIPGQANRAYCTFCQKSLHAHRLSLLKHTCTIRHQKAAQLNFVSQKHLLASANKNQRKESFGLSDMSVEMSNDVEDLFEEEEEYEGEVIEDDEEDESPDVPHYVLKQAADAAAAAVSAQKPPISTHVLDTAKGKAVGGLQVSLYKLVEGRWTFVNEGVTNPDGRCADLIEDRSSFTAGRYKLHFDVDKFFSLRKQDTLYPFIEIVFDCRAPQEHYHIPLLLSPFGYTTYRGT